MTLPTLTLPSSSVVINGTEVQYRALSRDEAVKMNKYATDPDGAEVYALMCGTGCSEEEATAFRQTGDVTVTGLLIDSILILSGLAKRKDDGTIEGVNPSIAEETQLGIEVMDPQS